MFFTSSHNFEPSTYTKSIIFITSDNRWTLRPLHKLTNQLDAHGTFYCIERIGGLWSVEGVPWQIIWLHSIEIAEQSQNDDDGLVLLITSRAYVQQISWIVSKGSELEIFIANLQSMRKIANALELRNCSAKTLWRHLEPIYHFLWNLKRFLRKFLISKITL